MRIAIVVHGRFHAFDLAREMIRLGQDVCVVTNYPKRVAARFGIAPNCVRNNLFHGVVSRVAYKIDSWTNRRSFEPLMHRWFSRLGRQGGNGPNLDVIHGFSGVCEEFFKATMHEGAMRTLVRGSAHIDEQFTILADEEERSQTHIEKPSEWMRDREKRNTNWPITFSSCRDTLTSHSLLAAFLPRSSAYCRSEPSSLNSDQQALSRQSDPIGFVVAIHCAF